MRFFKFSPDSKKLAYSVGDSNIIYDIALKKRKNIGETNNYSPGSVWDYCFSKDNKYIVMCNFSYYHGPSLGIWSVEDRILQKEYTDIYSHCYDMTKDNKKLLVGGVGQGNPGKICMFRPNLAGNSVTDSPSPSPFKFLSSSSKLDIIPDGSCQISGIEIANSAGKIVMTRGMEGSQFSIDISALASGAYYCRIKCGEKVYTEAFAVTR